MRSTFRRPSQLSESLHRRLNAYALAASAAGVGAIALASTEIAAVLSLTPVSEAEIIYTKTHEYTACTFSYSRDGYSYCKGKLPLDLGQKSPQFNLIWEYGKFKTFNSFNLFVNPVPHTKNTIVCFGCTQPYRTASALYPNAEIGPGNRWMTHHDKLLKMFNGTARSNGSRSSGPWGHDVVDRFLGLKFEIKGKTHYAWARLNTYGHTGALLTGYAYETTPDKAIIAGKEHGNDDATLGRLAQGASGVTAWRRKD
jgi:hypothetical protein